MKPVTTLTANVRTNVAYKTMGKVHKRDLCSQDVDLSMRERTKCVRPVMYCLANNILKVICYWTGKKQQDECLGLSGSL